MKVNPLNRISVLLVDDNAHMLHIVRTMLRGFGIVHIFEARDPAEGLDIARNDAIDIIVLDYQMDILDGLEFTRMIRTAKDSQNRYVPIILLTAYTERSRIAAARDAGVTEICAKPINANEMWLKMCACINDPRPFVRSKGFFGPDRRRRETSNYEGSERRVATIAEKPDEDRAAGDEDSQTARHEAGSPAAA